MMLHIVFLGYLLFHSCYGSFLVDSSAAAAANEYIVFVHSRRDVDIQVQLGNSLVWNPRCSLCCKMNISHVVYIMAPAASLTHTICKVP